MTVKLFSKKKKKNLLLMRVVFCFLLLLGLLLWLFLVSLVFISVLFEVHYHKVLKLS